MSSARLEVEGVAVSYSRDRKIVDSVSFAVEPGTLTAIIGPNGAGKSTLLKGIFGLLPRSGSVRLKGKAIKPLCPRISLDSGLAYLEQERVVFRGLTVAENFAAVAATGVKRWRPDRSELIPEVWAPKRNQRAGTLSGGEQTLLSLDLVMRLDPIVLLLDEILAGLSPQAVEEVQGKLSAIMNDDERSLVIVEQKVVGATEMADKVIGLKDGRLAWERSSEDVQTEEVRELFLVTD